MGVELIQQPSSVELLPVENVGKVGRGRWKRKACNNGNKSLSVLGLEGKRKLIDEEKDCHGEGVLKKSKQSVREVVVEAMQLMTEAGNQPSQML